MITIVAVDHAIDAIIFSLIHCQRLYYYWVPSTQPITVLYIIAGLISIDYNYSPLSSSFQQSFHLRYDFLFLSICFYLSLVHIDGESLSTSRVAHIEPRNVSCLVFVWFLEREDILLADNQSFY